MPEKPSIAVLAFTNLSGNSHQQYFADGVVDDIITELSRFRDLFVQRSKVCTRVAWDPACRARSRSLINLPVPPEGTVELTPPQSARRLAFGTRHVLI